MRTENLPKENFIESNNFSDFGIKEHVHKMLILHENLKRLRMKTQNILASSDIP